MTLHDLSQLYWLKRDIALAQERLQELEHRARSVSAAGMGGMPHGNDTNRRTERNAVAIASLRETIENKQVLCLQEQQRIEEYIAGIDNSMIREVYRLRFIDGLPWAHVAAKLRGGNTAESVRKMCYRYLEKRI